MIVFGGKAVGKRLRQNLLRAVAVGVGLSVSAFAATVSADTIAQDNQATQQGQDAFWESAGLPSHHRQQWQAYKARFLKSDGRIVDTGNGGISHTESQGTGLLFALFAKDRASFDKIWHWTDSNLRREDGLFAWKYDPARKGGPIADSNNATDGDLLLAWSLLLGAREWQDRKYAFEAERIIRALEEKVVEPFADRVILRPGELGFTGYQKRILNVSYCVFPALRDIAAYTRSPLWADIYSGCLGLVREAGFGSHSLPLDWVEYGQDGSFNPAPGRPIRFGDEAIRIPLYLIWAGHIKPDYLERFGKAWDRFPAHQPPPQWIDPTTGNAARHLASSGFQAVRQLVDLAVTEKGKRGRTSPAAIPAVTAEDDYYSASLIIFAHLAARALDGNS